MTIIPHKKFKKEFELEWEVLLGVGTLLGILFKLFLGEFIHPTFMIPMFIVIAVVGALMLFPSKKNQGKRVIEEVFIYVKYQLQKNIERSKRL